MIGRMVKRGAGIGEMIYVSGVAFRLPPTPPPEEPEPESTAEVGVESKVFWTPRELFLEEVRHLRDYQRCGGGRRVLRKPRSLE